MTIDKKHNESAAPLRVFVINLNRRPDRLAEITAELTPLGIKFERIEAVDARDFKHPHQHQGLLSWFFHGFSYMSSGMMACALSHQKAWQKIVDEKLPAAIVFEDDAEVADFDPGIFDVDLDEAGLDLLRIEVIKYDEHLKAGILLDRGKPLVGRKTYHPVGHVTGACAYLISYSGAKKLLKVRRTWFPNDQYSVWSFLVGLRHAILESPMFRQSGSESSIRSPSVSKRKRPLLGKTLRNSIDWLFDSLHERESFRKSQRV